MIEYHHLIHRIKSETYAKGPIQEKKEADSTILVQAVDLHPRTIYYQTLTVNGASFPRSLRFHGGGGGPASAVYCENQ
jgi:hypothetical protein